MTILTINKTDKGESYEINDRVIEIFKDHPEEIKFLIDTLKEKEVKLRNSSEKEAAWKNACETLQCISNATIEGLKVLNQHYSEDNLVDTRSDEEVESDVNKNYTFMNSEIKI